MSIKILLIAVVQNGDKILLRKKPDGSPPYKETWYLFGDELTPNKTPEMILQDALKKQAGINIKLVKKLSWDTEVKKDHDGAEKLFVYLDTICDYIDGELEAAMCAELEAHLAECPDCRVMVDTLRKTITLYRSQAPAELPSDVERRLYKVLKLEG